MKQITMRVSDEVADHLAELARIAGVSKTQWMVNSIEGDYDKVNGNPKLKELFDQMRELSEKVKQLNG